MNTHHHTLETLLLMALVELDSDLRFKTILKLDERIKGVEVSLSEDQLAKFIYKTKTTLKEFVWEGFSTIVVVLKHEAEGSLQLDVLGERNQYVYGNKRAQVDIAC